MLGFKDIALIKYQKTKPIPAPEPKIDIVAKSDDINLDDIGIKYFEYKIK